MKRRRERVEFFPRPFKVEEAERQPPKRIGEAMARMTHRIERASTRSWVFGLTVLLATALAGCDVNTLSQLLTTLSSVTQTTITADVATASSTTGLPETLSGNITGQFQGTYDEVILEVYFDATGAPVASLSRSVFTLTAPTAGTLTTLNLIVVTDVIVSMDSKGAPVLDSTGNPTPIGLMTSSTGEIIGATGAYLNMNGQIHTDSVLSFGTGALGLGSVSADLSLTLTP